MGDPGSAARQRAFRSGAAALGVALCCLLTNACAATEAASKVSETSRAIARAKVQACQIEKRVVETAAGAFLQVGGRYPTSVDELLRPTRVGAVVVPDHLSERPKFWGVDPERRRAVLLPGVHPPKGCA